MDEDDSTEVPPLSSNAAQRHQISKKSTGGRGTGTQASRTSSPHLPHDQSIARDTRTARKDTRGSQFASRTRDASPEGIGNVHHLQSASRRQGPSSEAVRDAASRAMSSKSAGLRDPRKRNPSLDIIHTPTLLAKNSTSSSSRNASSRMGPPPNFDGVARTEMGRPQPHGTYLARSTDNIMNAVSGSSRRGPESPSRYTPSSTSTRIYTAKQTQPRETRRDEASPIFSAGVAGSSRHRKISNPDSLVGESPSSRRRSIMTTTPQLLNVNVKSTPTSPFWRDADDEYEKARGNGRRGNEEEREINKRLAMSTSRPRTSVPGRGMPQIIPPPHRPKAYLGPKLKLTQPGEDNDGSDSPMEIDDDPPQDRRVVVRAQTGFKAARKREWPQRPSCSSPSEGDTEELPSSSEDDPDSDSDAPGDGDHDIEEIVAEARRSFKQPEIEILPGPPPGLAFKVRARPVLKEEVQQVVVPPPAAPPESREQVTNAIESLTGSIIRMQKTKQLPFLLRNLRNGFLGRCRELSIPVDRIPGTQRAPRNTRYPTPPPASNPLGPSAQPPYLPAEPDEPNGHIVYYSCRPGGPYLYDLVDTLPMEEFGVLKWEVIDREDEIWDSDNVKDEYKVMHALWGRWITLNRNLFIKDYSKGTIAFVDRYWRMIHRAAGWDALRYWLLMLVANRFINGVDVAKTLKHYEGLTGMDTWYD
ncbi:hypothetical protein H0H81_002272 [Sphagnurus paluster]|uniref:Uncharacterized protein n=1 Tax=Sphagnurus paluster TaxID=117069 RepID=A0A9P7FTE0_9AGAR|nr:hypothetical protein H0H81_002272 [Sphagnurus paluster]